MTCTDSFFQRSFVEQIMFFSYIFKQSFVTIFLSLFGVHKSETLWLNERLNYIMNKQVNGAL